MVAPLPAPPRAGVIPGIGGRVGAAAAGLRGGALGLLAGAGPAAAATLAVIAFQSLSDALGRVREGTEGADKAMESYIEAQRTLASADFLSAVDSLRNQAAELRESATGITGTIANVLADIGGESLNEQAARLETAAQEAADRAEARREVEISRISQLGEGETIFGTFIDGAEELRIGLETLDDAGSSAVTKVRQVVTALESMAAIDPDDFTVLDRFSTEDLAEQLGSGLATILSGVVGQTLDTVRGEGGLKVASFVSGKDGAPDIYRTLSESFGQELNTAEEVNRAILRFRTENGIGTSVPAETLVQDGLREELLALEGLRDILSNDELLNGLQSTLGSIVEQVAGPDGVLSTEDYQQVIDLAADAIRAEAPEIDDSGLRAALRSYLEGIERSTSPQLTQEVFREATEAVLSNINALPQQLQLLEGASPVESLTEALSYIDSLRDVADLRFDGEFSEELQLAYLQLTEQLLDAQAAVRQAERDLQAARLPTADVAGRRTIEREGLTANLDRARDRNDEQAILEAQTALVEFDRETVEGERERVAAVTRSSIDVRDSAGRLKADIQAATAELEATAQFDSDGNVTQAYAEASEEVAQLLNEQAERQRELAASIARAGIDPRDDVGNARADLDEAEANLAAQLPGTQEFYDAQRDVAEQRIELADRERALANAMARSGIDSRDDVANAAQDVREAQREVDAAIPGTVAFFEALRQLQDAQLAMRTALNARQDAQRRASLDPRDDLGNAAADVKAAQDALDATLPGTEAFFRAQRDLAEASLDLADQQRALADAIDLAGVAPGDEAGEAAARIRIAERALAATLPGTVAFYEALRELREAQAAVAEEQRAVADAQDLASVDSADEVGSAAVRIRIAQRALRNAARGSREYYQALRELKDAQEEMADAQAALRDAIELSRVDPGDEVGQARAELRIAERALRDTARGTREFYEALTAFKQAQRALADAIRARDDARDLAAVFPGSALQGATAQLRVAQRALEAAQVGTTEYYQALGGVREAQVALARAQSNARGNSRLLGTDLTNPIAEAQAQIANLGDMLNALSRLGAPGDVLDEIRLQIQRAKDSLEATQFNEKLSTMRDLVDIGAISDEQYVRYLESEKSRLQGIRNRTYQQNKQLIEIEKALQAANEEVAGQFNLGQIRVPTPFEVRRAIQAAVPGLTEIQNAADAFGTGSSNDPIGNLVDGSVVAVNNLAGHVNNFGNLVASIFGQLGIGGGNGIFGPGGGGGGGASGFDFGSATNWSDVMQGAGGGNPFWQPSSPAPGQAPGWGYGTPGGGWSGTTVTTTSPGPSVRSYSADLQAALNVFDEIASTRSDQMQFKDYLTSDQMRELGEVNTANLMQAFAASGMAYPEVIGGRYRTEVPASSRSYDMSRSSSQQITNTYNVQVDGADFGQVKTLFQRMFGEQVTSSRSAATSRKF